MLASPDGQHDLHQPGYLSDHAVVLSEQIYLSPCTCAAGDRHAHSTGLIHSKALWGDDKVSTQQHC